MHFLTVHSTCAFECVNAYLCVRELGWPQILAPHTCAAVSLCLLSLIHSNVSHSPQTEECGHFLFGFFVAVFFNSSLHFPAIPAQVPAAGSLEHEMQATRACTGHVLQEQTHTGRLHGEVASIPRRAFGEKHERNGRGVCCKHRSVTAVQVQGGWGGRGEVGGIGRVRACV